MKNKFFKIAGILIAAIALTLNVHNATTGHGIKGNKNLNPEILADGSSGSAEETFETYIPGANKYTWVKEITSGPTQSEPFINNGKICRYTYLDFKIVACDLGGTETSCLTGHTGTHAGIECVNL